MLFNLKIYKRGQLRQSLKLEKRNYLIGRSLSSDIIIPDNRVSRRHCSIIFDPEQERFLLIDLGSKQGTYFNGAQVKSDVAITSASSITFGRRSDFVLHVASDETRPLVDAQGRPDEKGHVTSEVEVKKIRTFADPQTLRRQLSKPSQTPTHEDASVAMHFYELSLKMSLAIYPQQEYQILADHIFDTTPADRLLLVKLHPAENGERGPDMLTDTSQGMSYQYSLKFSAFRPDATPSVFDAGDRFSRSMILRAVRSNQAILFSHTQHVGDSDPHAHARSSICAPLVGHSEILGCFYLDVFNKKSPVFRDTHLHLISMAAYFFALYLERERALEEKREGEKLSSAGLAVFGAAHYLKNTLTALQGSRQVIEMLMKNKKWESIPETWQVLARSVEKISDTVTQMLDFAREDQPELEVCDARDFVGDAYEHAKDRAAELGIDFIYRPSDTRIPILADRSKLDDVLGNLIINAFEAIEMAGSLQRDRLIVELRLDVRSHKEVVIEVADNGPGIPRENRSRVFDLFFTSKGSRGSGFGLALSRKYARQHDGNLTFRTSEQGTTFVLTLPLHESPRDYRRESIDYSSADQNK